MASNSKRSSPKEYRCSICGRIFDSAETLNSHKRMDHMVSICDIDKHKPEDIRTKGDCCFNHIIGLPKKASIEKPIFDYNAKVTETLERRRKMQISRSIFTSA